MTFEIDLAQRDHTRPLDFLTMGRGTMRKIYCTCGRIVDIDRSYFSIRTNLGKQVECSRCRNHRIGREIDALNDHFMGISEEESDSSDFLL